MPLRPNPSLLSRLVGYVEYTRALRQLEKLVEVSSEAELRIADEIVKDSERYVFYVEARRTSPTPGGTQSGLPDPDTGKKHGLDWVMALARVELVAMSSVTMFDNSAGRKTRPTEFERPAFVELMEHDTQVCCALLQRDFSTYQFEVNIPKQSNQHAIQTFGQRISMVEAFVDGCLYFKGDRSPASELVVLQQQLAKVRQLRRNVLMLAR